MFSSIGLHPQAQEGPFIATVAKYFCSSECNQESGTRRKALSDWCSAKGYDALETEEYVDVLAGKSLEKPELQRLLQDIRAGKIRHVVTFDLSNLSTYATSIIEAIRLLIMHGVTVDGPGEDRLAFQKATKSLIEAAKDLVMTRERKKTSERIKAGMVAAKDRGVRIGARLGEKRALGFRKNYEHENLNLVRAVLKMHKKGLSSYSIAETLSSGVERVSRAKIVRIIERHAE